jgi:hypothetical protein
MRDPVHYKGPGGSVLAGEEVDLSYRKIARGLRAVGYTPYLKSAMLIHTVSRLRPSIAMRCDFGLCYVLSGAAQCGVECGRILDAYVVLKIEGSKNAMCTPILKGLGIGRCGKVLVVEE